MKKIFIDIINAIQSLGRFNVVSRYKGEFEEGADWNPVFPACFIRLIGIRPELFDSSGNILKHRVSFILYIADKDRDEPSVLELIDAIIEVTNIEQNPVFLNNISWAGYIKGVEVYQIVFEIVF